ncbi:MAG TPA: hypothetical protein VJO32_12845, partial [Ktedonobacteraceae bacterium]|nr:hypothetical protein [Ktedonobacteraceae bacterium]
MPFPYEHYETLAGPMTVYYPTGQDTLARWVFQSVDKACKLLAQLLDTLAPEIEILLVAPGNWQNAPREEPEETVILLPYWTDSTEPSSLVVPTQLDPIMGSYSQEKLAFLLFHEVAHAFLASDPRPWPLESPLWADEWQLQFAALWLYHQVYSTAGIVMTDLHSHYEEIFEPEADDKTPVTVRGFDWYEDTTPQDYLEYTLLLERFAADLLARYDAAILPRFIELYRKEDATWLSDDVTRLLGIALGEGGEA